MRNLDMDEHFTPSFQQKEKHFRGIAAVGVDETEHLSDIDDFEVTGYLLKEEEKNLKRIIWEALNEEYLKDKKLKIKKPKDAIQKKKGIPAKKAAKTTQSVGQKRRSSKINYEALEKLDADLIGSPGHGGDVQPKDSSFTVHRSPSEGEEFQQELEPYEDNEMFEERGYDTYHNGGMDTPDIDETIDCEE